MVLLVVEWTTPVPDRATIDLAEAPDVCLTFAHQMWERCQSMEVTYVSVITPGGTWEFGKREEWCERCGTKQVTSRLRDPSDPTVCFDRKGMRYTRLTRPTVLCDPCAYALTLSIH